MELIFKITDNNLHDHHKTYLDDELINDNCSQSYEIKTQNY